jgi:hypothetical protein
VTEIGTGTPDGAGCRNEAGLSSVTVVTACLKEMDHLYCSLRVLEGNRECRSDTAPGKVNSVARKFTLDDVIAKVLSISSKNEYQVNPGG